LYPDAAWAFSGSSGLGLSWWSVPGLQSTELGVHMPSSAYSLTWLAFLENARKYQTPIRQHCREMLQRQRRWFNTTKILYLIDKRHILDLLFENLFINLIYFLREL